MGGGRRSALKIDLPVLQRGPAPEMGGLGGWGCLVHRHGEREGEWSPSLPEDPRSAGGAEGIRGALALDCCPYHGS